eukprot:6239017-Amphidinium_carterae.1
MPVPVVRRVIAPQPPPPPLVRVIPAQPQQPQQHAMAVQMQMVGIPPRPKPEQAVQAKSTEQAARKTASEGRPLADIATAAKATTHRKACTAAVTKAKAPGMPTEQKQQVELVYHGSFAPFHLGHLAVVEAAVRLVGTAMKPATVTTWISL